MGSILCFESCGAASWCSPGCAASHACWYLLLRMPSLAALCFSVPGLWFCTDWLALASAAQQGSLGYPSFCTACDPLPGSVWCSYGVPVLLINTPSGKLKTHTLHICKHTISIATDLLETQAIVETIFGSTITLVKVHWVA